MENKQLAKRRFELDSEDLKAGFQRFFDFRSELTRADFYTPILILAAASFGALLFSWVPVFGPLLALAVLVALSAVIVQRLRSMNYPWAIVFLGLVPFFGWLVLATLMTVKARKTVERVQLPGFKLFVIWITTVLTFALVAASLSVGVASGDASEDTSSAPSDQVSQVEEVDLEELAAQEEEAQAAAEAAELAEKARVEEEARIAAETDSEFLKLIDGLEVSPEVVGGYDRDLFNHWIDADGDGCDTRREVLIAESVTQVNVGAGCDLSGGTWVSAFDGIQTSNPSDFDVDHFVPLSEAWSSGANTWNADTRERFANDLNYDLSLIAVSASSNRSKSDSDPSEWLPPETSYRCEYVFAWVNVKYRWALSIDESEKAALASAWEGCSVSNLDFSSNAARTLVEEKQPEPEPTPEPTPAPVPSPEPAPAPAPTPATDPRFGSCKEAIANGYGDYVSGVDPEYGWYRDADKDGIVCER